MAKKIVITIARQYGSGGREIGERVAEMLGIPKDLYTPLFAVARCVSWCAHRMEELINNGPIIRPAYKPLFHPKKYVDLKDR